MKWQVVIIFFGCISNAILGQKELGLQVDENRTVLFGADTIGTGYKFMWIPDKGALRAGSVDGSKWNYGNIGYYSTALGAGTEATNAACTAIGWFNKASGSYATALGTGTIAASLASTAVGVGNLTGGDPINWIGTDPLFQVGNGWPTTIRSDALTILKNGQVHIPHGLDASLSSHGYLMLGNPLAGNIIIDDNEIMARSNGQVANLFLNHDGGNLYLGGNVFLEITPNGDRANLQLDINTGQIYWENSSRRFKENISTLQDDWTKILNIRPVKYTRPGLDDYWEYGYIAEEIDSIGLSNLVTYDTTGLPNNVNYEKMVLYLTEMIKLQQERLDRQQFQIDELIGKLEN
ncbi:MAG: tail fiber domain-containing protein [Saprospiraceae bacterium]|nr:tail fiber domain-containing protein [Saprospiraceae bacterium]